MSKWKLGHKSAIMVYRLTDDGDVWMNAEEGLRCINAVEHLNAATAQLLFEMWELHISKHHAIYDDAINALRAYAKELE